ncbi:MAG: right-handed parallel beta-helix repeat-containing protein [Paludibacteraceae bacterium]|nr:right-handed parallel beta-helix repeat-containing protein [Paludibacteraceae bacterium]
MKNHLYIVLIVFAFIFASCREETLSSDPSLRLAFSQDSIWFDTVFTNMGSATQVMMVYNPNRNAVKISSVTTQTDYFQLNLDGENDPNRLHDITINGKDSLYLFVRVYIPEQTENTPVLIADTIRFLTNGNEQMIPLQAYGQNVHLIRSKEQCQTFDVPFVFSNDKPYLIFDTLVFHRKAVIAEGATLYVHSGISLLFHGGLAARGTKDNPIRITSDRLDRLFTHVPYQVASGGWGGIYLLQPKQTALHNDTLNYTDILSGNVGLYAYSEQTDQLPSLTVANCRIHNHATYGIIVQNTDAHIYNTEISNCASYCLYLDGGKQTLTHNTIASFFGWPNTNINIHNVTRDNVAAVYINNLSKQNQPTEVQMRNCIVTGARDNNLVVATPLAGYYTGEFSGNYLRADTINAPWCHDNTYARDSDTVFVNTYYMYREYHYYDFRLDSVSPARGIGLKEVLQDPQYATDRLGNSRPLTEQPDAGCYQY